MELITLFEKIIDFLNPPLDIGAKVSNIKQAKIYSIKTGKEVSLPILENIDSNGEYNPIG